MGVTGDDRDAGVGEHCREVVHQAMGERWAVAAGDEVDRLLDPERQLLVEVPPDERRYLPEEAVAAVPFGTFQTLSAPEPPESVYCMVILPFRWVVGGGWC